MANGIRKDASSQSSAKTRRQFIQAFAAALGGALLLRAGSQALAINVFAQDEDNSGSGSGQGRGRGRGRGGRDEDEPENEEDDDDIAAQAAEVPPGSLEVRIVSDDAGGFVPAELTLDQGQSVAFVNGHDDEHTATGSGFDTGIIQPGAVATITLDTPGRFAYACQIHPEMTGTIAVRDTTGNVPEAAAATAAPAGATTVSIANLAFDPAQISVQTGATVVWTNDDAVPHTVTALDGPFDSGIFDPGASFSWTFDQPGSFAYTCQLHPQMQGTVSVGGEAPAAGDETSAQPAGELAQSSVLPTGVWLLDFTPANSNLLGAQSALLTLHQDGTLAADFASATAPGEQGALLGDGHGTWEPLDDGLGLALAALVEDTDDRFAGVLTLAAEASLDGSASSIDGTFTYEMISGEGESTEEGTGTISGRRIKLGAEVQ